jgi:hypothetical protein
MNDFEKDFQSRFPAIREHKRCMAYLFFLHPPMQCVGTKGTMPIWVQTGRAMYDVSGWMPRVITNSAGYDEKIAQAIGIELKSTKQRHPSLRIIGSDGDGSGMQAHQLEALAAMHRDGGIARILWNNGGIVGVMDGEEIAACFHAYRVSVEVERLKKTPARGARSVPWSLFRAIDLNERPEDVVLRPVKEPTLKQELNAKRNKARKQIDAAERERIEREDAKGFVKGENTGLDIDLDADVDD